MDSTEIGQLKARLQKFADASYRKPVVSDPGWEAYRDTMRLSRKIATITAFLLIACFAYIGVNEYLNPMASVFASLPNGDAINLIVK